MSGAWTAVSLAASPDPYVDWAAGPAFAELDAETGGACRYMVVQGGTRTFLSLDDLHDLIDAGGVLDDLAGPLPPDSVGGGGSVAATVSDDGDDGQLAVIVGIIDDGIAFANERFCKADGGKPVKTRFERFWLQDGVAGNRYPVQGYGREFSKDEINALLAAHLHGHDVDEDGVYMDAGVYDMRRAVTNSATMRMSHGTHVLDVAAGFSPVSQAQDARKQTMIAVQLPRQVTRDTSGKFAHRFILDGLDYIVAQAEALMTRIGRRLPVVVNLSYGIAAGPHDGSLDVCRDIDAVVSAFNAAHPDAPLAVVLAAGNGYLSRQRAAAEMGKGRSKDLQLTVLPDDRTSSYAEIWLPEPGSAGNATYSVSLAPPRGVAASGEVTSATAGQGLEWQDGDDVLARVVYAENSAGRGYFHLAWQATTSVDSGTPTAPSGHWTVTIAQKRGKKAMVDLWIQRDDSPFGFEQRGRQAYFDDPDYVVYDPITGRLVEEDNEVSYCRRAGTLSAFACGDEPLVIGAVIATDPGREALPCPAPYTAAGAMPRVSNPQAGAVAEDTRVHAGVLASATRSGSIVAMDGTSVATPQITRRLAAEMAAGRISAANPPKAWLQALAAGGPSSPKLTPDRVGAGVVLPGFSRTPDRVEA